MLIKEYPKLFSNDWFKIWQWLLLFAVNSPIKGLREEVRYRLGISLDRNILVNQLLKNSFRIRTGENEFIETFYGRDVFAKSVHRELLWIWNLIHKWDMNFANHLAPKLNLGFDTLTFYSEAGSGGENVVCDGFVSKSGDNQTFGSLWEGDGNSVSVTTTALMAGQILCGTTSYRYTRISRGIIMFDTSSLEDTSIITSAELKGYVGGYTNSLNRPTSTEFWLTTVTTTNNNTLVGADYNKDNFGTGNLGSITLQVFIDNLYGSLSYDLTAAGLEVINKNGITKFGMRSYIDIAESGAGWVSEGALTAYLGSSDNLGISQDPRLIITYTLPITGNKYQMII